MVGGRSLRQIAPDLLVVFIETAALIPGAVDATVAIVGDTGGAPSTDSQPSTPLTCSACQADRAVVISSGGSTGVPTCLEKR